MTLGLKVDLRNSRLAEITDLIDVGTGAGKLRFYDAPQPATGGTATTLLAELIMSQPSFAPEVSGVLTANAIAVDASANASGTATWFRLVDSDNNFCLDGTVGTSGADLNMNSTTIVETESVAVSSLVLTEGNA